MIYINPSNYVNKEDPTKSSKMKVLLPGNGEHEISLEDLYEICRGSEIGPNGEIIAGKPKGFEFSFRWLFSRGTRTSKNSLSPKGTAIFIHRFFEAPAIESKDEKHLKLLQETINEDFSKFVGVSGFKHEEERSIPANNKFLPMESSSSSSSSEELKNSSHEDVTPDFGKSDSLLSGTSEIKVVPEIIISDPNSSALGQNLNAVNSNEATPSVSNIQSFNKNLPGAIEVESTSAGSQQPNRGTYSDTDNSLTSNNSLVKQYDTQITHQPEATSTIFKSSSFVSNDSSVATNKPLNQFIPQTSQQQEFRVMSGASLPNNIPVATAGHYNSSSSNLPRFGKPIQ